AGKGVNLDLGRLHFEDERRWWWDDELDACRVAYETETFDIALALARELGPSRSDRNTVDPQHDHVLRLIGQASWDFRPNHAIEFFLLHQDDHSPAEPLGQVVPLERQDESDARLTWLGARLLGVFDLRSQGILGYWLDTALVRGEEQFFEFEEERSVVESITHQDVSGWGLDAGFNWILPMLWEPRLFAGYAFGSGDPTPEAGSDRSFRQTGLQANEAGFGGVQRFTHYGILLAPELSNLGILTLGGGVSLLRSSSLDLVYHHYRLVEPAASLRDTRLELTLTGEDRDVGNEIDIVLALEEWDLLELEFSAAAFRSGRAFGEERGTWSYGGFFALRIAF
ncbi:MAG: alginate export family protein, partial [bacterium]